MPIDSKYGRVTVENEPRGTPFGEDEPVVLFRSTDILLPHILRYYAALALDFGAYDVWNGIGAAADDVREWQEQHPDLVKVPN